MHKKSCKREGESLRDPGYMSSGDFKNSTTQFECNLDALAYVKMKIEVT